MSDIIIQYIPLCLEIFLICVSVVLSVAYLTYFERKLIAAIQLRTGPETVGPFGLLQPIADALKILLKEVILPRRADRFLFLLAPSLFFVLALMGWAVIPFGAHEIHPDRVTFSVVSNLNVGVLYILAISSLSVYSTIIAGWASNSNYSFLGALRSASQMISYEVSIGLAIIIVVMVSGSTNIGEIVYNKHCMSWFWDILLLPIAVIFFISILAETNRHPFDLPEAEAELVSGYNVEYSSAPFALFYIGEYANMILTSSLMTCFFLGGWYPPFNIIPFTWIPGFIWMILKIVLVLTFFIIARAAFPRYRYDQLMSIGWKCFLPLNLFWLVVVSSALLFCNF